MLELIAQLLLALAVAAGAQGVGAAAGHATPDGSDNAVAAIGAIIARVSAAMELVEADAGAPPDATGLDRAIEVADEHAADGLTRAAEARAAGQAKADAARAAHAPDVDVPPVAAPPVSGGPPAVHPPVPAPPLPVPPVGAP